MKKALSYIPALGLYLLFLTACAPASEAAVPGAPCIQDDDCGTSNVCLSNSCSLPPQYFLLFTHTEDHINHELSEERFWRFYPAIEALAKTYPDAHVSWTVEFMGADSETIAQRSKDTDTQKGTGLLDFIRKYATDSQVFQLGYHGAHEPTYTNNAIANLDYPNATWGDIVFASRQFLTLGKHPTLGGIDPNRSGGLKLMQEVFGPARIVSGYGADQAQIHAADVLAFSYVMFGFADHGAAITGPDYKLNVKNFMAPLCPERSTPCGLFWMNGKLRINDGNPVEGIGLLGATQAQSDLEIALNKLDPTRVQLMNVFIAPKFLYAKESPTTYAYDQPYSPQLPPYLLNSVEEKERLYQNSFENLEFLAKKYFQDRPARRFVNGQDIQNLFVNEAGQAIPIDRVVAVAQALAAGYDAKPPDFVHTHGRYYTLAESWSLIVQALAQYRKTGVLPDTVTLFVPHGPISETTALAAPVLVPAPAVLDAATSLAGNLKPGPWQPLPLDMIPSLVPVGTKPVNAAEYLRAAAVLLTQIWSGSVPNGIMILPASLLTDQYQLLLKINRPKYAGVCWSLKPAKHK
jgi:hypothetical protein